MHYALEVAQNRQQYAGLVHQQTVVCVLEAAKVDIVCVQQTQVYTVALEPLVIAQLT
jgi:hypothetical protein